MDTLLPLLGPLVALAAGLAGWAAAHSVAPLSAANDNAPRRSRAPARHAIAAPGQTGAAMLGKGKGDAKKTAGLSVIGADVTVTGNVATDGDLHVDGVVEGDVACGSLVQGSGSRIVGTVAWAARLAGTIEGQVSATALTVEKSARLRGDAAYQTVQIDTGAQVDGRMTRLAAGQTPANDAPLAAPRRR